MGNTKFDNPNRRLSGLWLTVPVGLSILFIAILLWSFGGAATAHADSPSSPTMPQNGTVTVPAGDPVEIAVVMFDGSGSAQDTYDAVQMAIDDYGAIKGWSVQRNDYDGGCDPSSGEIAANAVVTDTNNVGVIGPYCSGSTAAAIPVLETAGVVMISHASSAENLPSLGPTVFNRVVVSDTTSAEWSAKINRLPSVHTWEADFDNTYGRAPDAFAKYAYDAATLLLTRIDSVSTVDGSGNLLINRAALAAAVRGTAGFPGVTDEITLETNGNRVNSLTGTGTRYVATSGSDSGGNDCTDSAAPCASAGRGAALADDGNNVLIAAGTYTENLTISGITLTLRGGYAISGTQWLSNTGETIIDGNDAGRVFLIHDGSNVVLEKLTITGGSAPEDQCWGGGVSVTNGDLAIRNALITDNQALCTNGNHGAGGGLDVNTDEGPATLTVADSIVSDNTAGDHGGALNTWQVTVSLTNVLVTGNSYNVLAINESTATILNSTISDNSTQGSAILDFGNSATITIQSTIVWNSGTMDCGQGSGICTAAYSDIEGGWPGMGNINTDPQFVDTANGDYHLSLGSSCIDAGTDSGAPDHDLASTERPLDGDGDGTKVTDMGAYEFVLYQLYLPITVRD